MRISRLGLLCMSALVLLTIACASTNTPYDAPRVGVGGVAAVTGIDRYPITGEDSVKEVVIYHVRLKDGRECDQIWLKAGDLPDQWFSLTHQRYVTLGILTARYHVSAPYALCLKAEVAS